MYTSKPKSEKVSNKKKLGCYEQIGPYKKLITDSSWPILSIQEFKNDYTYLCNECINFDFFTLISIYYLFEISFLDK